MLTPGTPFDADKHPRGWAGRFSGGAGRSGHAHAMGGARRPDPAPMKRLHAVTPVKVIRPLAGSAIGRGFMPTNPD